MRNKMNDFIIAPIAKDGGEKHEKFYGQKYAFLVEKDGWVYNDIVAKKPMFLAEWRFLWKIRSFLLIDLQSVWYYNRIIFYP